MTAGNKQDNKSNNIQSSANKNNTVELKLLKTKRGSQKKNSTRVSSIERNIHKLDHPPKISNLPKSYQNFDSDTKKSSLKEIYLIQSSKLTQAQFEEQLK